jgi:hypothetical protein
MEIVSAGREYYIESWELVGRGTNTYGGLFFLYILVFPQQLYVPTWTYVYISSILFGWLILTTSFLETKSTSSFYIDAFLRNSDS